MKELSEKLQAVIEVHEPKQACQEETEEEKKEATTEADEVEEDTGKFSTRQLLFLGAGLAIAAGIGYYILKKRNT